MSYTKIGQVVSGIDIRATQLSDLAQLTDLLNLPKFIEGRLSQPFQSPDWIRRWLEAGNRNIVSVVATKDGKIVGQGGFECGFGRRSHSAELVIGVHDDFHGQGIGTLLVDQLLEAGVNWFNVRRFELTVFSDNERAIKLYKRFGFEVEAVRKRFALKAGKFADVLLMVRFSEPDSD